jgi:hypothetical protein
MHAHGWWYRSGEAETSTQAGVVDVTASAAEPTSSSDEEQVDAVASHPLPDMFGAQVGPHTCPARRSRPTRPHSHSCLPPSLLQELITELQDQESFGKRGEGWAFAELAALLLLLIPPFTLTVSTAHCRGPGPYSNLCARSCCLSARNCSTEKAAPH